MNCLLVSILTLYNYYIYSLLIGPGEVWFLDPNAQVSLYQFPDTITLVLDPTHH